MSKPLENQRAASFSSVIFWKQYALATKVQPRAKALQKGCANFNSESTHPTLPPPRVYLGLIPKAEPLGRALRKAAEDEHPALHE